MASNIKNRPNKQAKGFTKHYERRVDMGRNCNVIANVVQQLMIRGTTDHLTNKWLYVKKVQVEHPTDKGYFKTVYVLTDLGQKRFRTMKQFQKAFI